MQNHSLQFANKLMMEIASTSTNELESVTSTVGNQANRFSEAPNIYRSSELNTMPVSRVSTKRNSKAANIDRSQRDSVQKMTQNSSRGVRN